ncbi:MAG TPA: hypothetical protein VFP47_19380, partial [Pyrinomonadaceae bacterium]|nr:hypothetical protein [Pyrinomonadaceae bacterium]
QRQERSALEEQVSKLRQGVARLIDSYTEGLIEKDEFEPRLTRLRQRIAHIEEQCEALADEELLQREMHLIVSRLDDFAAQVGHNLDDLEWAKKRDIIRALVRRVEVGLEYIQVVFRVDSFPGESDPEKKSLQLCRGSNHSTLRYTSLCGMKHLILHITGFEPFFDQLPCGKIANGLHQVGMPNIVKCAFYVGI